MNKNTRTFILGLVLLACGAGIFYFNNFDIVSGIGRQEALKIVVALAAIILGLLKVLKTTD